MAKVGFIILSLIFMMYGGADGNQHCYKKKATQSECKSTAETCNVAASADCQKSADCAGNGGSVTTETDPGVDCCYGLVCCEPAPCKTTNETCNVTVSGNCQTSADCTGNGGSVTTETDQGADCCNGLVCCEPAPPPYCPRLSLDNGQVEYSGTGVGEIASFSCQENYTFCGHDLALCYDNGEWDKGFRLCITDSDNTNVNVTYEGSSYLFVQDTKDRKNFYEAQEFCENQGGYLVAINSEEELEFINCVRNNKYYSHIGLINQNGTWIWTSGQSISITDFFFPNEPIDSNSCGYMSSGENKWITHVDFNCNTSSFRFICEIPL